MSSFRIHFADGATILVEAATAADARESAKERGSVITKIKLDRGSAEPHRRMPRLTRRALEGARS